MYLVKCGELPPPPPPAPAPPSPPSQFGNGDCVQASADLNVRATPSLAGSLLGVTAYGSSGTVLEGPVYADGYAWYKIRYQSGITGWSVALYLVGCGGLPPPPPQPPPSPPSPSPSPTPPPPVPPPPSPPPSLYVGERIHVIAGLQVRDAPSTSANILGIQGYGSIGTIIGGPVYANGHWWWLIDFDAGADGWAIGDYLEIF